MSAKTDAHQKDIAGSREFGELGVAHLKRYWSVRMHHAQIVGHDATLDWARDRVVIHGLGIGIEQAARHLGQDRTFAEFEAWILACNGGRIAPTTIARLNAALTGAAYDADNLQRINEINAAPPVLTEADLHMWTEHGYTVLHNAITPAESAAVVQLICEQTGVAINDPNTWYSRANSQGIMLQIFQHAALDAARKSRRVHKAYSQLWGTADLLPTTDRCSFNPPERTGNPFPGPHLHWDIELTPPVAYDMQGVLYLTDTAANQGVFTSIPGFHKTINTWLCALPAGANPYQHIPVAAAQPIKGKAGDLVIWNDALPHGASANRATAPRLVQYVKMFPARS
jgi:ectoine hydroxylase-related dioxygenase (phytanoyl-CoA dioxygenase family)